MYHVGVAIMKPVDASDYNLRSLTEIPGDNKSKPFLALHPLSSKISDTKSHFKGNGLASPKEFDNFWLYTKSKININ